MKTSTDLVEQIGSLPPLPGTAVKIINLLSDPRSTVPEIVEVIKYDQAVTTEVLRLVNSAYFGLSRKVTSVDDAMICLGTVKVLQLVMSIHTTTLLAREQQGYGLEPGVLWKHSVAVALASSAFAQRIKLTNANLVFTAGLLHDIGKVVLNQYVAEEFAKIVNLVNERGMTFNEAENQVLGYSHEEIGGMIAQKWQLPEPIVSCIRYHHDPSVMEAPDPLVDVVYLANSVCLLLGVGLGEDGLHYRAKPEIMQRYDLKEPDLEEVGVTVLDELKRVEQLFTAPK